jgi:hypothetical protein
MKQSKKCEENQPNKHAPDFTCDLKAGHSEPHRDPRSGLRWRHLSMRPFRTRR